MHRLLETPPTHWQAKEGKWLSNKAIADAGYEYEDIEMIRDYRPDNLEDFRKFPPEILIVKCLDTRKISFSNDTQMVFNKGKEYIIDMLTYIDLSNMTNGFIIGTDKFKNRFKKYEGQNLDKKEVLCWLYGGGFGDITFVNPILKHLKEDYPTCRIRMAIPPQTIPMVKTWGFIDEIISLPCLSYHFNAVDYHLSFDSVIVKCKEAERLNVYKLMSKWIMHEIPEDKLIPYYPGVPAKVEKFKNILGKIGVEENKFMVLQLEANTILRTPRDDFRVALMDKLAGQGIKLVIIDRPKKKDKVDALIAQCKNEDKIFNLSEYSTSIDDPIGLMQLSGLVISVDTGIIHMAAALGAPTFGIYGPFPGKVRLETYKRCRWVDGKAECAPCFQHGMEPCDKNVNGYCICYDNIDLDDLTKQIMSFWGELKNG